MKKLLLETYHDNTWLEFKHSKSCLNRTLNKPESCIKSCIKSQRNKYLLFDLFLSQQPVYSEHIIWSENGLVKTGCPVYVHLLTLYLS